jgi:WD40 repeat protein
MKLSQYGLLIISYLLFASFVSAQTVPSIAFLEVSPDGNYVAGVGNQVIRIWDTATGNLVQEIPQNHYVHSLSWSPSGDRLATISDYQYVRIWNVTQAGYPAGTLLGEFDPNQQRYISPESVGWSPDGQLLAVGGDAMQPRMQLWDANTYEFVTELPWSMDVSDILWNPDSQKNMFATYLNYDYSGVSLISTDPTQQPIDACPDCPLETLRDVRWNPSGTALAIADDQGRIHIVDEETRRLTLTIQTSSYINMIAWNPNGTQIASANSDGSTREIQLWNATTGELLGIGPSSHLVAFNPTNQDLIYVDRVNPTEINSISVTEIVSTCPTAIPATDTLTLLSAIASANATPEADTICLEAGTYTLDAPITSDIMLHGLGTGAEISGTLHISGAGQLTLRNVTVNP